MPSAGVAVHHRAVKGAQHRSSPPPTHSSRDTKSRLHRMVTSSGPGLLMPSALAFYGLLLAPLVMWLGVTSLGISHFDGLPANKQDVAHFMLWFDVYVFRTGAGPALPFLVLLVRWSAVSALAGGSRPGGGSAVVQPSLLRQCGITYLLVTVARLLVYVGHLAVQGSHASKGAAYVSDHVMLGASVVVCLQAEMVCCLSDIYKLEVTNKALIRSLAATLAFFSAICLFVFVTLDMYYTCKFFHHPQESLLALLAGLALFQAPVLRMLKRAQQSSQS